MNEPHRQLKDHFDDPYHRGPCDSPTHAAGVECKPTGCQIAFELCVDGEGRVLQAWFDGEGCVTCEAVASMLAAYCEGRLSDELQGLSTRQLSRALGLEQEKLWEAVPCAAIPLAALQACLASPLGAIDGDLTDGTSFGGPSLREEC